MSLIRFLLPWLFRQPRLGDRYLSIFEDDDPFVPSLVYTVVAIKGGWVKLAYGEHGAISTRTKRYLIAFFTLLP